MNEMADGNEIHSNPAIRHFKGPIRFMPYWRNALLPFNDFTKNQIEKNLNNEAVM